VTLGGWLPLCLCGDLNWIGQFSRGSNRTCMYVMCTHTYMNVPCTCKYHGINICGYNISYVCMYVHVCMYVCIVYIVHIHAGQD
jgi:hypothetical protein